jgi:hypothetical protein
VDDDPAEGPGPYMAPSTSAPALQPTLVPDFLIATLDEVTQGSYDPWIGGGLAHDSRLCLCSLTSVTYLADLL